MTNCPECNLRLPNDMPCHRCADPGPARGQTLNTEKTVAVSNDVFWIEDMTACPRGVKVQLLGIGGVATYGTYDGKDPFWVKWQSVPRNRPAAGGMR